VGRQAKEKCCAYLNINFLLMPAGGVFLCMFLLRLRTPVPVLLRVGLCYEKHQVVCGERTETELCGFMNCLDDYSSAVLLSRRDTWTAR